VISDGGVSSLSLTSNRGGSPSGSRLIGGTELDSGNSSDMSPIVPVVNHHPQHVASSGLSRTGLTDAERLALAQAAGGRHMFNARGEGQDLGEGGVSYEEVWIQLWQ
jgi:hypothetical protein